MGVLSGLWHALLRLYFRTFYRLEAEDFTAASLSAVQGFNSGDNPDWALPVNEWITGGGAVAALTAAKRRSATWLYWHRKKLVGYGSLGTTVRPVPPPRGPKIEVSIIPFFGVDRHYHGRPRWAARSERFSGQIILDLIGRARLLRLPLLTLYCHIQNKRAMRFYEKFDFKRTGAIRNDHELLILTL